MAITVRGGISSFSSDSSAQSGTTSTLLNSEINSVGGGGGSDTVGAGSGNLLIMFGSFGGGSGPFLPGSGSVPGGQSGPAGDGGNSAPGGLGGSLGGALQDLLGQPAAGFTLDFGSLGQGGGAGGVPHGDAPQIQIGGPFQNGFFNV